MSDPSQRLATFSPDGHEIARGRRGTVSHTETLSLSWDNEAWTAVGRVGRERVEYVLRLAPTWHVRQFLLFRDLDDPDLWLAIDAAAPLGRDQRLVPHRARRMRRRRARLHAVHGDDSDPPARSWRSASGRRRRHRRRRRDAGDEPRSRCATNASASGRIGAPRWRAAPSGGSRSTSSASSSTSPTASAAAAD